MGSRLADSSSVIARLVGVSLLLEIPPTRTEIRLTVARAGGGGMGFPLRMMKISGNSVVGVFLFTYNN